jgi:hypothetical protein
MNLIVKFILLLFLFSCSENKSSKIDQCIDIRNASDKVVERGTSSSGPFKRYSWQATIINNCEKTIEGNPYYQLFDMRGYLVEEEVKSTTTFIPQKNYKINGMIYVIDRGDVDLNSIYSSSAGIKYLKFKK